MDFSNTTLELPMSITLDIDKTLFLKAALLKIVQSCLGLFSEAVSRGVDYEHWLDDPVLMAVMRYVLVDHLTVQGVLCSLRPWSRRTPDKYLAVACAPVRLNVWGTPLAWRVDELEDLRELSHAQIHAAI